MTAQTPGPGLEQETPGIVTALASMPAASHLDVQALARILGRCKRSVERAVRRGELPAPLKFMGHHVWLAGVIVAHLQARQDAELKLAARRERRILEQSP